MGGMRYRIASFNMYKMNFESDKDKKKDFKLIADIIKSNGIDIVAMQEVLTPNALDQILLYLPGWDKRWDAPRYMTDPYYKERFKDVDDPLYREKGFSRSKSEAEGYAFIWNTNKFALSKGTRRGVEYTIEPYFFSNYRIDRSAGEEPLAREPYFGRFRALSVGKEREIELRLINTHIIHGGALGVQKRKKEFLTLIKQIYRRASSTDITSCDTYTILLGDYNLNLNRPWTKAPYLTHPDNSGQSLETFQILEYKVPPSNRTTVQTVQESLTTLKDPNRENYNPEQALANNFDHFSFDIQYKEALRAISAVNVPYTMLEFRDEEGKRDYEKYKKSISDHLPITVDLNA